MSIPKSAILAALASAFLAVAVTGSAWESDNGRKRSRNLSISDHDPVNDCSDLRVNFGRRWYGRGSDDVVRGEKAATLPVVAGRALAAEASRNGGVYVIGSTAAQFEIDACLFATGDSRAQAEELLGKLSLTAAGSRAAISGPEENDWVGFLIVRAPRGSAVDVRSWNGPVAVRDVSGRVQVESENGPVSLKDTSGEVEVRSENGPVHISGSHGKFVVRSQNGPLHVELSGARWQSGSLDASTQNGPIHLEVPEKYESGVLVDASRHSPVECNATQCRQAVRTWAHPNRIEFGGAPAVRLSTVNGPVTVTGSE